uniref:Orphan G-protein coupled receptor 63 n=1 Tax=Platynereis dumerilii TaxID=6359 RepID=A0A0K0PUK2_PLADU|nr:orphan G-protein coupled receptor 63 [Platynereis dumerilii]
MSSSATEGTESFALVVILLIVCCLSVIVNLLILIVIASKPEFRSKTEAFISNMAASDIMLAGIAVPIKLAQTLSLKKDFTGGDGACKLMMFLPMMSIMTSIYTMAAISFDRYFSIVRNKHISKTGMIAVLLKIWIISGAFASPTIYEYSVKVEIEEDNTTETSCGSHGIPENFEKIYATVIVILAYVLPLLMITVNYTQVALFLWKAAKRVGDQQNSAGAVKKHKIRITKMLALISAIFALCWAPFFVLFTIEEVTDTDNTDSFGSWPHTLKVVSIVFSTMSNFVIYITYNSKFRWAFLGMMSGGRCARPDQDTSGNTDETNAAGS